MRPSVLLTYNQKKYLIDVGPEFRMQALKFGISDIDGLLITHTHFDHIAGIDDLRAFYLLYRKKLPALASKTTLDELTRRYDYLFKKKEIGLAAQIDFIEIEDKRGKMNFNGLPLTFMTYSQAGMEVTGFRFGKLAYIPDIKEYDSSIYDDLKDLEILVVSALRERVSPVHFNFEDAIRFSERVGAKKTYFMHISHEVDHETYEKRFPPEIKIAYDGLTIQFENNT